MSKIIFKFTSPLLEPARKGKLSNVVRSGALELESDVKQFIQLSKPSGEVIRLGAITRAASKNTKAIGLRHFVNAKGKERAVVAYKFHRQSAIGQPPAILYGGLIGSIQSKDLSETKSRVSVGKKYGQILDTKLRRFFFKVRVDRYRPIFKQKIIDALKG